MLRVAGRAGTLRPRIVRIVSMVRASEGTARRPDIGPWISVLSLSTVSAYPVLVLAETTSMRRPKAEPEQLLSAIAEAVDDGFYPASSLASDFPKLSHREVVRLRKRALREGLLLERRGPDGRTYLALTSEGWQALRTRRGLPENP
jgi:hypothetical protein